ncbi:MAG: ComF family protein [Limnochordia bacterium]|jgi:competence protein ComFC
MLGKWGRTALELLFPEPPGCAFCQSPLPRETDVLCSRCWEAFPLLTGGLIRPWPLFPWGKVGALGYYQGNLKEQIRRLKFGGQRQLGESFGRLLAGVVLEDGDLRSCQLITWIPVHGQRLMTRGYDQSYLIAQGLSKQLSRRLTAGVLERIRPTAPQAQLVGRQRWENVAGAFRGLDVVPLKGKRILLIDDVLTTGATGYHAAQALLEAGAAAVNLCVLAISEQTDRG